MTTPARARGSEAYDRKRGWFGLLLAPAAWTLVEGLGYVLSARECAPSASAHATRIRVTQLLVCAIGLVAAIVGLRIALAHQRALGALDATGESPTRERSRFVAASGVLVSALFIGGILLFALSAIVTNVCERAHA